MAYKTEYIEQQLTRYLKDYSDGKTSQEDIDWVELDHELGQGTVL